MISKHKKNFNPGRVVAGGYDNLDAGMQAWLNGERRSGSLIESPHVNISEVITRKLDGNATNPPRIQLGLGIANRISSTVAMRIVGLRESGGLYTSLVDFHARLRPCIRDARVLVRSGCLDGLPFLSGGTSLARPQALWAIYHLIMEETGKEQVFPFANSGTFTDPPGFIGDYKPYEKVVDELRYFSVIISCIPSSLFARRARELALQNGLPEPVPSSHITGLSGKRICVAGILVSRAKENKRLPDAAITLEDEDGLFDAVIVDTAVSGRFSRRHSKSDADRNHISGRYPFLAFLVCGTSGFLPDEARFEGEEWVRPTIQVEMILSLTRRQ